MVTDVVNALLIIRYLRANPGLQRKNDIAKALHRKLRTFENLLQRMARCGLIFGKRGPNGGHELTTLGRTADVHTLMSILLPADDRWILPMMLAAEGMDLADLPLAVNHRALPVHSHPEMATLDRQ